MAGGGLAKGNQRGDRMPQKAEVHRVDFHLHSYASNVTDYYAANTFAIPESYSDPFVLHRELKGLGMSLMTLTDHNSIDCLLELLSAGMTDVFVSAEMTTTFPEDGCNIHVTVANMTEAQFREVNRLRGNVYEMIAFVDREIADEAQARAGNRLAYFMTHPLMST
jgi:predicted metal-dependent phosphoesterase TrpH